MINFLVDFVFKYLPFLLPKAIRPGYVRVVILYPNEELKGYYVKLDSDHFTIEDMRYEVDSRIKLWQGRARTPTNFYIFNNALPVDLRGQVKQTVNARENKEKMESHVASDAINAVEDESLFQNKAFLFLLVAIIGVGIFLWYNFDAKLSQISTILAELQL
jgi:hypothetical protein